MQCISTAARFCQDVRHVLQLRPVELQVLPRGEVAVALVVVARDVGELPHLARVERAVGDGDPQHVGVELQVDAVLQPERLELLLVELAGEPPRDLVAELRDPLADEGVIELVVAIHGRILRPPSSAAACLVLRMAGGRPVGADLLAQPAPARAAPPSRVTSIA